MKLPPVLSENLRRDPELRIRAGSCSGGQVAALVGAGQLERLGGDVVEQIGEEVDFRQRSAHLLDLDCIGPVFGEDLLEWRDDYRGRFNRGPDGAATQDRELLVDNDLATTSNGRAKTTNSITAHRGRGLRTTDRYRSVCNAEPMQHEASGRQASGAGAWTLSARTLPRHGEAVGHRTQQSIEPGGSRCRVKPVLLVGMP
jgi:hypothetical protein